VLGRVAFLDEDGDAGLDAIAHASHGAAPAEDLRLLVRLVTEQCEERVIDQLQTLLQTPA